MELAVPASDAFVDVAVEPDAGFGDADASSEPPPVFEPPSSLDPAACQVVQSPQGGGFRLVADSGARASLYDGDAEIRLTYRELAALIEEAVERLR